MLAVMKLGAVILRNRENQSKPLPAVSKES
jgi:hypothetical protein